MRYYSNLAPVPAAAFQVNNPAGGPASTVQVQSDSAGTYAFTGLSAGTLQLQGQKPGDINDGVSTLDAVYILQAVMGLRTLNAAQRLACDVSGNGSLSNLDAVSVLQYTMGLIGRFSAANQCGSDWAFLPTTQASATVQPIQPQMQPSGCQPGAILFDPLTGEYTGADFSAVLFGDCTGNWQPGTAGVSQSLFSAYAQTAPSDVRLGRGQRRGRRVRVPLYLQAAGEVHGITARIAYDPAQLRPLKITRKSDGGRTLTVTNTRAPGLLTVSVASVDPFPTGPVLWLEFTATQARADARSLRIVRATVE